MRFYLLFLLVLFSPWVSAYCETDACLYNPQPASDDVVLPMPGGLEMVFRKVIVPGNEFWGNRQRIVKVGDVLGDFGNVAIFEGIRKVPVAGSFYDWHDKNWYYHLGKYEVSIGQYVAMMGDGNQTAGLAQFYEVCGDSRLVADIKEAVASGRERKLRRLLAEPLRAVSWFDFQAFIRQYNHWCYQHDQCLQKLPHLPVCLENSRQCQQPENLPGFFRLPTELEWEYAARGGLESLTKKDSNENLFFEHVLPFERVQADEYAWLQGRSRGKGPTIIGRLQATYGFYDLFGNVQELTTDLFAAEGIQGKIGGLSVRGGYYNDSRQEIRSSLRSELDIYQRSVQTQAMQEMRSHSTGMRLTIGSLVIRGRQYLQDIRDEFQAYKTDVRPDTTAGLSTGNALVQGSSNLRNAQQIITGIQADNEQLKRKLSAIQRELTQAEQKTEAHMKDACFRIVSNIGLYAKTAGRNYSHALPRKALIEQLKSLSSSGSRASRIHAITEQYQGLIAGFEENMLRYKKSVEELRGYPARFVSEAIDDNIQQNRRDAIKIQFFRLLQTHLTGGSFQHWKEEVQALSLKVFPK